MKALDDETRRRIREAEPLAPARHPSLAPERARLVKNMRAARQEIAQIFIDVEYWNAQIRKPHEQPVDPDPNGDLKLLAGYYDRLLKNDTQ